MTHEPLRGQPANAGQFRTDPKSAPDVALTAESGMTWEHDGTEVTLKRAGEYLMSVTSDPYSFDYFSSEHGDPKSPAETQAAASRILDRYIIETLKSRQDDWGDAPERTAEILRLENRLAGRTEWDGLEPGDSASFEGSDLDEPAIDTLEVYRSDEDRADGSPQLVVEAGVRLNMRELTDDMSKEDSDAFLNRHSEAIVAWSEEEYGNPTFDGSNDDWESQTLVFTLDESESVPGDLPSVLAKVTETTKIVDLHNDLNGAYQSKMYGYFGSLRKHLDDLDAAAEG